MIILQLLMSYCGQTNYSSIKPCSCGSYYGIQTQERTCHVINANRLKKVLALALLEPEYLQGHSDGNSVELYQFESFHF